VEKEVLNLLVARFELDMPLNLESIITKKRIIKFYFFMVIRVTLQNKIEIFKKQLEDFEKLRQETISLKTLLEEERRIVEVRNV
jgi:hypothetical protein